ncbi:GGDEF domain-containing protein [Butyrivibrio sp. NC2007]|uniref:GGDEF domain-containing protein n=1 Tax=Butyrivibrio sp. NC2007 TaxID=1280683 RepID=UPI0003B3DC6D|nr:GGDEF domain-containing protein [Butyrivibrio sp. NC2007]
MQTDLIIKENELIDPAIYPEDQRGLVEDFNARIKRLTGIITGIGKEYHTIWVINSKTMDMDLYRSTGENTNRSAMALGFQFDKYDRFIEEYVDRFVVTNIESIQRDVKMDFVLSRIKDGDLFTLDYMRLADDGNMSYHQMAFALAGQPGETDNFILAFRDIDKTIRKHIADKRYLREQLDIVETLSRDYYNIFKINPKTGDVVILKLDGYVTKGMEGAGEKVYSYDVLYKQYVKDRVYSEDQEWMYDAISLETIKSKLKDNSEYVSSYRVMDKGEVHYYQFTYILINANVPNSDLLAGFKNVDDIVASAKERQNLEILASTDLMTGILNRGSGERKVIDAMANNKAGMLCILDIDKFKEFNDKLGHNVGDKVLRGIADVLKITFRDEDIIFRLGGDEYAAYVMNLNDEEAGKVVLERLFSEIAKMDFPELEERKVCVSAGAAFYKAGGKQSFEELYKLADSGVYESKKIDGSAVTFR